MVRIVLVLLSLMILSGCGRNEDDKYVLQEMKDVGIYTECELVKWSFTKRVSCYDEENDTTRYLTIDEYYELRYDNENCEE